MLICFQHHRKHTKWLPLLLLIAGCVLLTTLKLLVCCCHIITTRLSPTVASVCFHEGKQVKVGDYQHEPKSTLTAAVHRNSSGKLGDVMWKSYFDSTLTLGDISKLSKCYNFGGFTFIQKYSQYLPKWLVSLIHCEIQCLCDIKSIKCHLRVTFYGV